MLRLESSSDKNEKGGCYPLLADQVYTVGRKQGDITFPNDQSVSRTHCQLEVQHPAGNITEPHLVPVLQITDSGSKFGTFASEMSIKENIQIPSRESITLPIGEKVRFGLQWNEYRVAYTPLVVTTSSMRPSANLKSTIVRLGGHLISEWDGNVTHVVMESITLTVKVVCALLAAKPIVTPAYITDLVEAYVTKKTPPDPNSYLPPVTATEKEIINLKEDTFYPNTARTTLFLGKTFLFCTAKHLKKLSAAIEAGGGTAELITKDDEAEANIASSGYIIMGQPSEIALVGERDTKAKFIIDNYKRSGKRFIGDSEIGLAAVFNSLEKFCNPRYNMAGAVFPNLATQTQASGGSNVTIVQATQEADTQKSPFKANDVTTRVVNETVVHIKDDVADSDDDVIIESCSTSRGTKRYQEAVASSSKKRSAVESLPGPSSKRIKEISEKSKPSLSLSNRSQSKNNPARALTSLFNFSDSDDDDDEKEDKEIPIVSETQPPCSEVSHHEADPRVIQDSQAEMPEQPLVKIVDVCKLQSMKSTQESVASVSASTRQTELVIEDEVRRIPDSPPPESEDDDIMEVQNEEENRRMTRNRGTDFVATITTSIMNAKTMEIPKPSSSSPKKTREQPSTSRKESTRKRPRDPTDEILSDKTKKMNLEDLKGIVKEEEPYILPLIKRPLVNRSLLNKTHDASILSGNETRNGGTPSKNFKTFKKVLPKFISAGNVSSGTETVSGRSTASVLNASIESIRSTRVVKLVPKDYDPGHSKYYHAYEDTRPPPVKEVRLRGEQQDTPEGFRDMDSLDALLDFNLPVKSAKKTASKKNEEPIPSSSSKKNSQSAVSKPSTSSAKESSEVTSQQRRSSPRKKGPSRNEDSVMPPPLAPAKKTLPQPIFVPMEDDDDESDEDDMWSFNR